MKQSNMVDPFKKFAEWYESAQVEVARDANAVVLATATQEGIPSARVVLLKSYSEVGFVFYTNWGSQKGVELAENPKAALCFFWSELGRQIRVVGDVTKLSAQQADDYFATRPRKSQIGAWASKQSQKMDDKNDLEKRVIKFSMKWGVRSIERPPFWGGFLIEPYEIEFWEKRPWRLHKRTQYTRGQDKTWQQTLLYP